MFQVVGLSCKATILTDSAVTNVLDFGQAHCHGGQEDAISVAKSRKQMNVKATYTLDRPSTIFSTVVADMPP